MVEISEHMPSNLCFEAATTGTNPFHYCTFLADTVTEGHVDSTHTKNGLPDLTCFRDFTGDDLVLKELGARTTFPLWIYLLTTRHRKPSLHHYGSASEVQLLP